MAAYPYPIVVPVEKDCIVENGVRYCEDQNLDIWPEALWAQALVVPLYAAGIAIVAFMLWVFVALLVVLATDRELWPLR